MEKAFRPAFSLSAWDGCDDFLTTERTEGTENGEGSLTTDDTDLRGFSEMDGMGLMDGRDAVQIFLVTDNLKDADRQILGVEKISSIFGCWPSFHDAEIAELNLYAGGREDGAVVTLRIIFWQMSSRVDAKGFFELDHVSLGTLRFVNVEDLELSGFGEGNILFSLDIQRAGESFFVKLESTYGVSGTFKCRKIEVVDVTPWAFRKPVESALNI